MLRGKLTFNFFAFIILPICFCDINIIPKLPLCSKEKFNRLVSAWYE